MAKEKQGRNLRRKKIGTGRSEVEKKMIITVVREMKSDKKKWSVKKRNDDPTDGLIASRKGGNKGGKKRSQKEGKKAQFLGERTRNFGREMGGRGGRRERKKYLPLKAKKKATKT